MEIKVNGMSCGHCVSSVTKELEANNAQNVQVNLETGMVSFDGDLSQEKVKTLIEDLGFSIKA